MNPPAFQPIQFSKEKHKTSQIFTGEVTSHLNINTKPTMDKQHDECNNYRPNRCFTLGEKSVEKPKTSYLLRRSSSVMRVRELREVLNEMTSDWSSTGSNLATDDPECRVLGSQKARLLVASQQRLVSRLQDLRHQLDSMDNEVTRVKCDIMNSRRYFSAMTGIDYGPKWSLNGQLDSAYTSPTSFSHSSDDSPCISDADSPSSFATPTEVCPHSRVSSTLETFEELAEIKRAQLPRSDSCSSFLSWRSDVELAGVFPEEADPASVQAYQNMCQKRMLTRESKRNF